MNVTPQMILDRLGGLPTLPHIAAQVLQRIERPETSAQDLQAVLETDQAVAVRVLRAANSAFYGLPSQVKTLRQAVIVLGYNDLRSVVLATCIQQLLGATGPARELLQSLWQHSLLTAVVSRLLAGQCRPSQAEEAFVGGLLHDIGKVALVRSAARQYVTVAQRAQEEGLVLHQAEEAVWGFNHAAVGALMLEQWGLPREHREAVGAHHHPESALAAPVLTALVSLANEISHQVGDDVGPERPALAEGPAARALGLEAAFLDDFLVDVNDLVAPALSQWDHLGVGKR